MNGNMCIIYAAKFLRTFAFGAISVVLALYLSTAGFSLASVGMLFSGTLVEDAVITLLLAMFAPTLGLKRVLIFSAVAMAVSGFVLGGKQPHWLMVLAIVFGVISPAGFEGGAFSSVEQSIICESVEPLKLTRALSLYNLAGFAGAAFGALFGGWSAPASPNMAQLRELPASIAGNYFAVFAAYTVIGLTLILAYSFLKIPKNTDTKQVEQPANRSAYKDKLMKNPAIALLAGLQSIDAFAGGLLVQSFLSYWFLTNYHCSAAFVGDMFFITNILAAASFLAAPYMAERLGLLRTMVFTHLPCSLALIALPFIPNALAAAGLLIARSLFSSMDIPARQSFAMLLVEAEDRPFAVALISGSRSIAQGLSPSVAGVALSNVFAGMPFVLAGLLKTIYDLSIFCCFADVAKDSERLILAKSVKSPDTKS